MQARRSLWKFLLAAVLLVAASHADAVENITIRTGQVGGVPGVCAGLDDSFRYDPVNIPPCGTPFRNAPFSAADFAAAAGGPPAQVITAAGPWLPSLSSDPLARWIDWERQPGSCFGSSNSMLYAVRFNVQTTCSPVADIRICWAVDDGLGDVLWGGPNPVGIYLNGVPLDPGFSAGSYATETCYFQANVPVSTGANVLYVYQRDQGCAVAGLLLSASLSINPSHCPSLTVFKFNDANGNGVQDGGESGLPGWQINISGPSNQSATTNAAGVAFFPCLPIGPYQITETPQPGWIQTYPSGGVHHLDIGCDQDFAVSFGNRRCDVGQGCVPLPKCLTAWYPLDECAGTVANEVIANNDGVIVGGPNWVPGRFGLGCALNFPGSPGTQRISMLDYPQHDFGTGSFSIVAWVRTSATDSQIHTIVDKRQIPFLTPTGYALYLYQGVFRFQYNDGVGPYVTHVSTHPPINDGQWHQVAVTVCRNPLNPALNTARLIVDGTVDTFVGAAVEAGNLSNNAGLTIGDQCPGFIVGIPFAGAIDDVQLYRCCLTPDQIFALRTDLAYCNETCRVPTILTASFSSVNTTLTLCNYAPTPQTYTWSIAGLPAGPGCSVNGPTVFSPYSGTVTVPAGPACVNIPINIALPPMGPGQTTCYQVTTQNVRTGECCVTRGRIRKWNWWHFVADPQIAALLLGDPTQVRFVIHNSGPDPLSLDYRVADLDRDGLPDDAVVSLNGLPPGEPVIGTLVVAPMDSAEVVLDATLREFQPMDLREIVILGDLDGDGEIEPLGAIGIAAVVEESAVDVPDWEPAGEIAPPVSMLSVMPNPFYGATGVRLTLAAAQPEVRVAVFDIVGRLVSSLHDGPLPAGEQLFSWDGRDRTGRSVGSGIYFVRAQSAEGTLEAKLIRLR